MSAEVNTNRGGKTALRHVGAVLELSELSVRVWINGVTDHDGQWIDRRWLPPILHDPEATFDAWLYDGDPIEFAAFAPQIMWVAETVCIDDSTTPPAVTLAQAAS